MLRITFWSGINTVTGANFLVEGKNTKFLIDCGLLQGVPGADEENKELFPYDVSLVGYLFLTHAHMDHIGRVPKLVKEGFKGVIYSTEETRELAEAMFLDAVKVMATNLREEGKDESLALYNLDDVTRALSLWKTLSYHTETKINEQFMVKLLDAGHILGSSMYEFYFYDEKKKIVFTGDSGNSPAPLLKDTDSISGADYIIVDSVYGDRNHEPREERDEMFRQIVSETIAKGGTLVIPAFSIERTQVVLYELNNLIEDGKIRNVPVYLDSPLGEKVTEIYKRFSKDFNSGVQKEIKGGDKIFNFPRLQIIHGSRESKELIHAPSPKIIISGSGMSTGGRVVWHEKVYLPDPQSTVLLMGYQALGTLGRRIQDKPREVEIKGEMIPINARIEMISGYSSHKDSDNIVEMVANTAETVKKVFVVMGEPKSAMFLSQRLRDELEVNSICPEKGVSYELN